MGKLQKGVNNPGAEYNINFNLSEDRPREAPGLNQFESKNYQKFRG